MSEDRCLVVFTKPARPGRVKTRLIGALDAGQAAALHAAFLDDLLERLQGGGFDLEIAWALDPGEPPPPAAAPGFRQEGADLGERLYRGLARAARDHGRVAAVGSDHPDLPLATVERAFAALGEAEIVLGPAEDGGYYLIGARAEALRRELFEDIAWSTDGVYETTVGRCRRLGLRLARLPVAADVDTPADLDRLAAALERGDADCPRTRALLASWRRPSPA